MITLDEALRLGRAYGLSLIDVAALREMAADVAEAKHIAIQLGGTDAERADEAYTLKREQQDAERAAENEAFAAYQTAHPKPAKSARKPVVPDLSRAGMTDRERMQATQAAHEANVRAEAEAKSDEVQEKARDYYDWKASLRRPEQGGD